MDETGSPDVIDRPDYADPSPNPANDADLAVLCDAFQEWGITQVVVRYEGSGDSGCVEDVRHEPATIPLPGWAESRLRSLAEGYCPAGYANQEGGYGTLTIYPFRGLAELEHNDHYEDTEAIDAPAVDLPARLRRRLTRLGVTNFTVFFDGYGGSGQFDDLTVEPPGMEISDRLWQALERFLLGLLPGGWEINAGSFGTFTTDVPSGKVEIDASWRVEKDADGQVTRWRWRK